MNTKICFVLGGGQAATIKAAINQKVESQTMLRHRMLSPGGTARTQPVWARVLPGG